MKNLLWSVVLLHAFALLAEAQTTSVLRNVPEDALGFVMIRNPRQLSDKAHDWAEVKGARVAFSFVELFLGNQMNKEVRDDGSIFVLVIPGKGRNASPCPILALPLREEASFRKSLSPQSDIYKVDLESPPLWRFAEANPFAKAGTNKITVLIAKREDFVFLAAIDRRDELEHVLKAKSEFASSVETVRPWFDEQDLAGAFSAEGLKVLMPLIMPDLPLVIEAFQHGSLIAFGTRFEKEGKTRISTRIVATQKERGPQKITEPFVRLLGRVVEVGVNAGGVATVKVDDANTFLEESAKFVTMHSDIKVQPSTVKQKSTNTFSTKAATWVMAAMDRATLVVGHLRNADDVEKFVVPPGPLSMLISRRTPQVMDLHAKNLLALGGVHLRDDSPMQASILPASMEVQVVMSMETLQAMMHLPQIPTVPPYLSRGLPLSMRNKKSQEATQLFWDTFHGNAFEKVDKVIADLTSVVNSDPSDPVASRLLGASYSWKFMERGRGNVNMIMTGISSLDYLGRASKLEPNNRVLPAILGCARVAEAKLRGSQQLLDNSFEMLRANTRRDPRMHGFVQGWVFTSMLAHDHPSYSEGVNAFFATLDSSNGFPVPRRSPGSNPLINAWLAIRGLEDSACYNSDVSPHNLEGTYLGLGDALLKQGQMEEARRAYQGVKDSPNYKTFKFQDVVESRLARMEETRDRFRTQTGKMDAVEPAPFFQSRFSCTACHAK